MARTAEEHEGFASHQKQRLLQGYKRYMKIHKMDKSGRFNVKFFLPKDLMVINYRKREGKIIVKELKGDRLSKRYMTSGWHLGEVKRPSQKGEPEREIYYTSERWTVGVSLYF